MKNLPKIALGAWAWGNDGTFGGDLTADSLRDDGKAWRQNKNRPCGGGSGDLVRGDVALYKKRDSGLYAVPHAVRIIRL